jgi:hypothetical protein
MFDCPRAGVRDAEVASDGRDPCMYIGGGLLVLIVIVVVVVLLVRR